MASLVTNSGSFGLQGASGGTAIVWGSDTIKSRIVISSVTPLVTSTSMTGMTAATGSTDQTVGSKTQTNDTTNNRTVYTAAASTWSAVASGSTVGWVVYYKFVTNDAGSTPIFVVDVADTTTNGSDLSYTPPATGIGYSQQ